MHTIGGRQCSGDMLLVMSASWLSKRTSPLKNGLCSLYVHKAISFESSQRTYLDTFDPPRRVTYLVNLFTRGATDNLRDDAEELEVRHGCFVCKCMLFSFAYIRSNALVSSIPLLYTVSVWSSSPPNLPDIK